MSDDLFIDLYVIIMVEMKPVYWGLKGNQGTMVTYVFIYFNMICLMYYVWWLIYRLVCNLYGWNETSVRGLKRNQDTMVTYIYMLQYDWIDVVCVMIELYAHM